MKYTRSLKIWTLLTHALIIIGAGHGIIPLLMVEFFSLLNYSNSAFPGEPGFTVRHIIAIGGLFGLFGKGLVIFSILTKKENPAKASNLFGILCLWAGLGLMVYSSMYIQVIMSTAIPFFICTMLFFFGKPLNKLYHRIIGV